MWLSARDLDVGRDAPGVRLFCLPHAGSGAAGFYRWKRLLPATIAVCPVLLPGREARLAEPSLTDAQRIADELHAQAAPHLNRPYAVFAHSMGALLAYEWLLRIAASGLPHPLCFFASGRKAPQIPSSHTGLHRLAAEPFVHELKRRYGGEPEALIADPELQEVFLPILRSDLQVVETYSWRPSPPLACPIHALAGETDASVSPEGLQRWSELTTGPFATHRFPGDHFYSFHAGQQPLLAFIAETLNSPAPHSTAAR